MNILPTLQQWITDAGVPEQLAAQLATGVFVAIILLLSYIANVVAKRVMLSGLTVLIRQSTAQWDDILLKKKVFSWLAHLAPAAVIYMFGPLAFADMPEAGAFIKTAAFIYMVFIVILAVSSFLEGLSDIFQSSRTAGQLPLTGFLQAAKLVLYFVGGIIILSAITNKAPLYFLSGLGAFTVVLMLVFKDVILGFVAGIQLATNNMVQKGDWIEMPQYGADGDVMDVTLTTVKVRNFDKTITTIPTYALISSSFKNWRGMQESGGRRIKRSINIDISSIKFCDEAMLERFGEMRHISQYMADKKEDVSRYNVEQGVSGDACTVNGRRLTNVGTYRSYIEAYLREHPRIHKDMTFLVRQLAPTEHGLPIEIYVFTNDTNWVRYEAIQADIFDHLLAALGEFGLRAFQQPTGADFQSLRQ